MNTSALRWLNVHLSRRAALSPLLVALVATFYLYESRPSLADGTESAPKSSHYGTLGVAYEGTNSSGVEYYHMSSPDDGPGTQQLRILAPTHPAPGVPHSFLFVLPVEAGLGTHYGDGMKTLRALDAEDRYDLTIVEPTFSFDPWYANDPTDHQRQYETFMTSQLVPWVRRNLSITGKEQNWLIGFSKSGLGGQDLILKHPTVFSLAASWDFPAAMTSATQYGAVGYGTQANFSANYELSQSFVAAHAVPFRHSDRIWIGGYAAFGQDDASYDTLLTANGIKHTTGPSKLRRHRWDSGWVPVALAALEKDSRDAPRG